MIEKDTLISFLNFLNLCSRKTKALHWAAPNRDEHNDADGPAIREKIQDLQDTLAEQWQGINYQFSVDDFNAPQNPEEIDANTISELCEIMANRTSVFIEELNDTRESFMKLECINFIGQCNRYIYLGYMNF